MTKKAVIALQKAEAQFIGFSLASHGYDIRELASSMGLEKSEWEIIKKDYSHNLDKNQIKEIDDYFQK